MIRRPPRSTQSRSSAASDVYKRQVVRCKMRLDILNRLGVAHECDRQTDGQTEPPIATALSTHPRKKTEVPSTAETKRCMGFSARLGPPPSLCPGDRSIPGLISGTSSCIVSAGNARTGSVRDHKPSIGRVKEASQLHYSRRILRRCGRMLRHQEACVERRVRLRFG